MSLNDDFNVSQKPEPGELLAAVMNGDDETVESLLKRGADVNEKNSESIDEGSALVCAATYNHATIVRLLIDNNAALDERNSAGDTALIVAARQSHTEIVQMLVEKGVDLDARNDEGSTALIEAARCNSLEDARLLIDNGADISIKNNDGHDALALAIENGNLQETEDPEMVQILSVAQETLQRIAEAKEKAAADERSKRLHVLATERQQQLRDQAKRLRPRLK